MLGKLLLHEDRGFHTIQTGEVTFNQAQLLAGTAEVTHVLIAAARYLIAHVRPGPDLSNCTPLHRGDRLFEG